MDLLEFARAARATGPLCDACLGRPVADRSFGLTNTERGRALRTTVALDDDKPIDAPDECWVCEGACEDFDDWADRAADAIAEYDFDTYQVGTRVPALLEENERLLREDAGLAPDAGEPLKGEFNREVGKRLGGQIDAEVDFDRPDVQLLLDLEADSVEVQVNSAFVYGRYRKIKRDIPQTEWPCNDCNATGTVDGEPCEGCGGTGYRYDESVEELTAPVVREAMDGSRAVFHGAGREDVDARMLGTGRPFVIEVKEPRTRDVNVGDLQDDINEFADGKVEVEGLALATHDMVERVKAHDASKTYRMTVEFAEEVNASVLEAALAELEGKTIEQRTPNRVAHRRGDIVRTRDVYAIDGKLDPDGEGMELAVGAEADDSGTSTANHATIEVHGEGGLYVKELISGDEGRTEPSLAGLLDIAAEVTALDVLHVEGEDEPFEREAFFRDARAE